MFFLFGLIVLVVAIIVCWFLYKKRENKDEKYFNKLLLIIFSLTSVLFIGINSYIVVPVGSVYVASLFQHMQQRAYVEGVQIVNPFLNFMELSIRRRMIDFGGIELGNERNNDGMISQSSNNVPLTVDATFATSLNPQYAWWVFQKIGDANIYMDSLIVPIARASVRSSVAKYTSEEATTSKREELAKTMEEEFAKHLALDLISQGIDERIANNVFNIHPVQIRQVLPPKKVLEAIADKAAADEDFLRQKTLTSTAEEEANRRGMEGIGVANLFTKLPPGFTAEQIALVTNAIANKTKADAFMKGVESGNITTMVIDGSPTGMVLGK